MDPGVSDDDDGGAVTSLDLQRLKQRMPKKVYHSDTIGVCDPAALLNAQLFESIGVDDNDQVLVWLKHGAPVDSRNSVHGNGATPLIEATTRQNAWLVRHFVKLGADASLADEVCCWCQLTVQCCRVTTNHASSPYDVGCLLCVDGAHGAACRLPPRQHRVGHHSVDVAKRQD